ncbi:MAG: lysophospholipid acyltransferase family protein [Alphaproteobacteria bacterium]
MKKTTKWKIINKTFLSSKEAKDGAIFCSWHSRIVMLPVFYDKSKNVKALVSLHRDGRIIADLLKRFGFEIIGGSSSRNARAAAVNLMKSLKNKEIIAIIPDGPRGPAQKMTMSPIYFAHKTGVPIFACAYSIKKAPLMKKSWDKMMVPVPFSDGSFICSKAFYVPKDATEEQLEKYRQDFEIILNDITKKADKMAERK